MKPDWIAVDWGTSNLRAYAMKGDLCLAEAGSDQGMGQLSREAFEPALLHLLEPWLEAGHGTPVIACGMVGSRQGWREAPYRAVPCAPTDGGDLMEVPVDDPRISVHLVPGLKQVSPADVMRGEETQIAGALAILPGFDGVICLPGTHSKWTQVSAGEVVSFQTYMTGEMFALLSKQSVLRHGMTGDGWDAAAFDTAVSDALSRPERIAARLFALRAEGLLASLPPASAKARLSGMLIGLELAGARAYWLGQPIVMIGAEALSALYTRALAAQGASVRPLSGRDTVLAGLTAAWQGILEKNA
ncbi:MAG: 2-keto-3-deoxy-galactonokinase [Cereibacter sphaeroides]|uniref:2-keto-3-deoxy-galactonokinase n=1 Tax=Cereibacter sphaeroides TaxID=1063 RepID=A0A2W5SNA9_CERSP|nr:MAG: 2-keto-3-deoxy-galactonokinase [Cereibacter sphaeroides]